MFALRVRGDSMIDEQIRDGDFVVVEDRKSADNGEMVIALLRGSDVTLKKFYRDPGGRIRLQPANATMEQSSLEERTDPGLIKEKLRVELRRFLRKRSGRRPFVLPVIMEI